MTMNMKQVRVVDPVLTNVALGYQNAEMVGHFLFPRVEVFVTGGQVIEFGKEAFRRYNLRRAPGAGTTQIQFGYAGKPYALVQDALETVVPREWMRDASVTPGVALGTRAVKLGMDVIQLALESEQAVLARTAANYGASNKADLTASSWRDPDRDPAKDVVTAQEVLGDQIGHEGNVLVLSNAAFAAARTNPHVLERFKGMHSGAISKEQLAAVFDVEQIHVGRARYEDSAGALQPVWGQDAILAYAPPANATVERPSYGYTYTMSGHPMVEQAWYCNTRKSWVYPVTCERAPQLTGISAGYLFTGAGAPFTP